MSSPFARSTRSRSAIAFAAAHVGLALLAACGTTKYEQTAIDIGVAGVAGVTVQHGDPETPADRSAQRVGWVATIDTPLYGCLHVAGSYLSSDGIDSNDHPLTADVARVQLRFEGRSSRSAENGAALSGVGFGGIGFGVPIEIDGSHGAHYSRHGYFDLEFGDRIFLTETFYVLLSLDLEYLDTERTDPSHPKSRGVLGGAFVLGVGIAF